MCEEEEGGGKAGGGGVSSIIHQLMYQAALRIYLSLQGAERLDFFSEYLLLSGSASLSTLRSSAFSSLSLLHSLPEDG